MFDVSTIKSSMEIQKHVHVSSIVSYCHLFKIDAFIILLHMALSSQLYIVTHYILDPTCDIKFLFLTMIIRQLITV